MIHNLADGSYSCIPETAAFEPSAFVFLYIAQRILLHVDGKFQLYTFQGTYLFSTDVGKPLERLPVAVGTAQGHLCAVSQTHFDQWIYVFSIWTGEILFETHIPANRNNGYKISAIAFNDTTSTLVTGNEYGELTFWE
jgi:hypothetical protein